MAPHNALPEAITTETALDDLLSRPYPELVEMMRRLEGDLAILGVAGKIGISLAAMAARAVRDSGVPRKVYGVSRFSDPAAKAAIEAQGVIALPCDLMDRAAVAKLPDVANVIFMAGRKFGTGGGGESLTWAMNAWMPGIVCERYAGSRIVAFSTGCVYPLVSPASGGCRETDPPNPVGEYAQSCLGRERVFEYFSRTAGTQVCLFRLNYALDLRYGVLHDLARTIWEGRPVNRTVDSFNAIWQGDANNQALLALELADSPSFILNVTGPETASVTQTAETLGRLLDRPVSFANEPGSIAYLSNASEAFRRFGYPRVTLEQTIRWTADWFRNGGRSLNKPTHFDVANGQY